MRGLPNTLSTEGQPAFLFPTPVLYSLCREYIKGKRA